MLNNVTQYVTRKRRAGEEIENSDGFDEYIGRKYIRTVKFVNGIPVDYAVPNQTIEETISDEPIESTEPVEKESTNFLITVHHSCGQNEFIIDYTFDIEEYSEQLNKFYWDGFVSKIEVEGL